MKVVRYEIQFDDNDEDAEYWLDMRPEGIEVRELEEKEKDDT